MARPTRARTDEELMNTMADGVGCHADPLLGGRRWTLRKGGKNIGSASTYAVDALVRKGLALVCDGRLDLTAEGRQVATALQVLRR